MFQGEHHNHMDSAIHDQKSSHSLLWVILVEASSSGKFLRHQMDPVLIFMTYLSWPGNRAQYASAIRKFGPSDGGKIA